MPIYPFKCKECGAENEVCQSMELATDERICLECGHKMRRVYSFHAVSKGRDYHRPIVSNSLAMTPSQIPEHRKLFPEIEVTREGQPVFDNYKKHDEYLKKVGMVKQPGKSRMKSKKETVG